MSGCSAAWTTEAQRQPTTLTWLLVLARWFLLGAALIALGYQIPVRHTVQIGSNDGGYVQGFNDAQNRWGVMSEPASDEPFRWSRAESFLVFPQVGLPAEVSMRWRPFRTDGAPKPTVRVLLNGTTELGTFPPSSADAAAWETHTFALNAVDRSLWLKPDDIFVSLQTDPPLRDGTSVQGVQVAQATIATTSWPIIPAVGQVLQGGIALVLAALVLHQPRRVVLAATIGGVAWLLLYRLPLVGFPLRHLLRYAILGLGATLAIQHAPRWTTVLRTRHVGLISGVLVAAWLVVVLTGAQHHTVLSEPGVEKDFRVFATRSNALACPPNVDLTDAHCVLRADGFYQLGYPLLLWLLRPATADNPFLAARLVAVVSGMLLLFSTYLIALRLLGRWGALLAVAVAALNGLIVQYTLLLGTDLPFAAAWTGALATLVWLNGRSGWMRYLLTGALCGAAFLLRHPGLLLLPLAFAAVALDRPSRFDRSLLQRWGWLGLGFGMVIAPQIVVNSWQTGQPLYSQQAKNIWLAVYGNTEFSRWGEAANNVRLLDLIRQEPARFFANWGHNLLAFFGTGAGDTSEFGQAIMLRLVGFPANLLALGGLIVWLRRGTRPRLLVASAVIYVVTVAVGFALQRFFLPLVPIWSVAAASAVIVLAQQFARQTSFTTRWKVALALGLVTLLVGNVPSGFAAVLDRQNAGEVAMVQVIERTIPPMAQLEAQLAPDEMLAKYSAIAHRFTADQGAAYILWSERSGKAEPTATLITRIEHYSLYQGSTR